MKTLITPIHRPDRPRGFTLIELLIGTTIMLFVIVAALAVYSKSNQISVDQQQYAEIQNDVRSAMFLVMRDARMIGAGMPEGFRMYSLEGVDNEDQGSEVQPDRLTLIGNIDWPLSLQIQNYQGAAASLAVEDYSLEQYPYADTFYVNKTLLILPNTTSPCRFGEVRTVTNVTHPAGGTNEAFTFSSGLTPNITLPMNLLGTCLQATDYAGGAVMLVDVKVYWLDVRGSQPGLTAGVNGYLGLPGVLYMTNNGVNNPIAQNIENFQIQYNGDFNDDGILDGFQNWNPLWTMDDVNFVRQIRVLILGRTANRLVSVSGTPAANIHNYRRPALANSPAAAADDLHRRFLLESTSNVRNLSLNLYNRGER
jgi:prepilin-type N-terminal cleavage/methylation domain-containing protein